jgi:hypothetical protein
MRTFQMDSARLAELQARRPPDHHLKHVLSRRAFLGGTAGVTAATVGAGLLHPTTAFAAKPLNAAPKPTTNVLVINGTKTDFHVTPFAAGVDPSSITDFNGHIGVAEVQGTGRATNPDGSTETLLFDTDMRFMSGVYVGQDGTVHKGTFGFV